MGNLRMVTPVIRIRPVPIVGPIIRPVSIRIAPIVGPIAPPIANVENRRAYLPMFESRCRWHRQRRFGECRAVKPAANVTASVFRIMISYL